MQFRKELKWLCLSAVSVAILFAVSTKSTRVSANNYYSELFGGVPLVQNWTDTNQITTNDNWTGVVSYQGFRGDGLTSSTGVDPQTIVADGQQTTPLDVNANQPNPNTFNTGGVTEFEIADPTLALKGSGTADAPHLMLYVDLSPCPVNKSVSIRYNVRDLDGSANDAVQQLALQYRIGTTGPFTNVPAGFVADATEPSAATKVTAKLVALPAALIGNPQVEIRFITANAAGTDEWIGIDDIEIGCFFPTAAEVTLTGRVMTAGGRGIPKARVGVLNTLSLQTTFVTTNHFGYFTATDLPAGDIYLVTVHHRKYAFSNHTRALQLFDDKKGIVFYADAPSSYGGRKSQKFE